MTVTTVNHGSHLTRTPKKFDGFDIVVGDYIAGATDGRALQIVSITSKTTTTVTYVKLKIDYDITHSEVLRARVSLQFQEQQLYSRLTKMDIQ